MKESSEETKVWSPLWEQWPQGLAQGAEKVETESRCVPNPRPQFKSGYNIVTPK